MIQFSETAPTIRPQQTGVAANPSCLGLAISHQSLTDTRLWKSHLMGLDAGERKPGLRQCIIFKSNISVSVPITFHRNRSSFVVFFS